ncbi:MAG: hypothetical protein ACRDRP_09225 [Pseudonocardiaceae bacterium]
MTWALCLCRLDRPWHAVTELGDHPGGLQAVCGHRWLPRPVLHDEPTGPACEVCADSQPARAVTARQDGQISGRPPVELPHHRAPRGRPGPASEGDGTC